MKDRTGHPRQKIGKSTGGMVDLQVLAASARKVLAESPAAPVRVRLLRDVIQRPEDDPDLIAAVGALEESPHVQALLKEQRPDGGWGRFHTADSRGKEKIPRTEMGVQRAVELGLARSHRVFTKAERYLRGILDGSIPFPDQAEKHENWPTGVAMFAGAMLSTFAPESPALDRTWEFWAQVARRSFASGRYDLDAELRAHRELLGRSGDRGWLRLNSKYVVMILGARAGRLPPDVESAYLRWLCEDCPRGLVYVGIPLDRDQRHLEGWNLHAWLMSLELLSSFPSAPAMVRPAIERLSAARNAEGLWDFGTQPSRWRFSDNYRRKGLTAHDWTTRVACLLRRYLA